MRLVFSSSYFRRFLGAALLLGVQLSLALCLAPSGTDSQLYQPLPPPKNWIPYQDRYHRLANWDSYHYFEVVERGYHLNAPATTESIEAFQVNGSFFPGYPLWARWMKELFSIDSQTALLISAQLATFIFWIYLLSLGIKNGLNQKQLIQSLVWTALYPTAFFFVTGYSESLFCAAMLGYLYWCDEWLSRRKKVFFWIAVFHGMILSATRLFALPILGYPFLVCLFQKKDRKVLSLFLAGLSASGTALFFLWCHWKLGSWDLYFKLQKIGWGNATSPGAIFRVWDWYPRINHELTMTSINRVSIPVNLLLILTGIVLDLRRNVLNRMPLYVIGLVLLYLSVIAKAGSGYDSLSRYTLPIYILSILALTQMKWKNRWFLLVGIIFLIAQAWIGFRFLHGKWVT